MEPLRDEHFAGLCAVAFDAPVWRWTIMARAGRGGLRRWVDTALANAEAGTDRPFATIDIETGPGHRQQPLHVDRARTPSGSRSAGPGSARRWQRSGRNREAKLLQLTHAFETLDANRVEFKTHSRNVQSRTALRGHRRHVRGRPPEPLDHGRRLDPDSAWFSVIRPEWPEVKRHLQGLPGPMTDGATC